LLITLVAGGIGWACGGDSDSEVDSPGTGARGGIGGGAAAGGGGTAGNGGTAGKSGSGGSSASGGGGAAAAAGSGGSGGAASCPTRTSWVDAVHFTLEVTWPGTTAGESGSGRVHVWSRVEFAASGNDLQIGLHACGSVLPQIDLTVAGRLVTGGERVLIVVPDRVWDAASVPTTPTTGAQSGSDVGSSVGFSYTSLLGVTLSDPMAAWPSSGTDLTTFDLDDDMLLGYTAEPRNGDGYVLPPTGIGIAGSAPSADRVYLVSRQSMTLDGTRTACDAHSGSATVSAFDNHVVGCHIEGGSECSAGQTDFVDQNRTQYVVTSATYEARTVAAGASCSDVRAALPAE
jgi:hypothetical protein